MLMASPSGPAARRNERSAFFLAPRCPRRPPGCTLNRYPASNSRAPAMQRPSHLSTRQLLEELLDRRILLLDGSMGAYIFTRDPAEEDYRGSRFRHHPA